MSETRKLDKTGLSQVWSLIVANFAAKTLLNAIKEKIDNIEENAQVNVIEKVSVNGAELEVTEKGINILVPSGTLAGLDEVSIDQLSLELKNLINGKADSADSLSGYGITDAYTKTEVDSAISNAVGNAITGIYRVKGSVTFEDLPASGQVVGDVYNVNDEFTTTSSFIEGAGHTYPAGTNVVYTENGWDCMAGIYDFSGFLMADDLLDITEEEINAICVMPE